MLESDGANLSQGQRQLISIARAAVADAPVMILDEATSSIDTRTERLVQKGTDQLMHGRTVFVIAHRLSTVQNSDVIMVLDHGHIIERGSKLGDLVVSVNGNSLAEVTLTKALSRSGHILKRVDYSLGDKVCCDYRRKHYPNRAVNNRFSCNTDEDVLFSGRSQSENISAELTVHSYFLAVSNTLIVTVGYSLQLAAVHQEGVAVLGGLGLEILTEQNVSKTVAFIIAGQSVGCGFIR